MLNQERVSLDQEKLRVQNLLNGMQEVMNVYNASGNVAAAAAPKPPMIQASVTTTTTRTTPPPMVMVAQSGPFRGSPAGEIAKPFS